MPHTTYMAERMGTATLAPVEPIVAGEFASLTLTYTAGFFGIDDTGSIKIVFRFATDNIAVQLPGTGAFELDPDAGTARLRATFTFLGETFEVVIVDGNAWTRVSDEP